jgi:galactitol PTS system EIIB component
MIKGLVACGSGIATSTVAQEAVKKILAEANIQATITKGSLTEIPVKQDAVDIIFVTSNYNEPTKKPLIKVFGLISGINKEGIKKKIIEICRKIECERVGG